MKKDIPIKKVTDIAIAIVPTEKNDNFWDVYFLNLKEENIKTVLITSKGYGKKEGEKVETTMLRYFYEIIGPQMAVKIEPIDTNLFDLTHEYWISFKLNDFMYDKKYVFVRGSLHKQNFTKIPLLDKEGIMIK